MKKITQLDFERILPGKKYHAPSCSPMMKTVPLFPQTLCTFWIRSCHFQEKVRKTARTGKNYRRGRSSNIALSCRETTMGERDGPLQLYAYKAFECQPEFKHLFSPDDPP